MTLRIVLIRPPGGNLFRWKSPPLGIASLASYLRLNLPTAIDIKILDFLPKSENCEQVVTQVMKEKPDIVGISFLTAQALSSYELAERFRKNGVLVVAGGIHPTVCPEEVAKKHFDFVVCGEGEEAFLELVTNFVDRASYTQALASRKNVGEILSSPLIPSEKIPAPAWDLVDPSIGYNESVGLSESSAFPVMYSRGCAFSCSFCASSTIWNKKVRWRSVSSVVDELIALREEKGVTNYHFYDDDFMINPTKVHLLLEELEKIPFQIEWTALATVQSICRNSKLLPLLRKAGCRGFDIGIESADPEVLKVAAKRQQRTDSIKALRLLKDHGFPYVEPLMMYFSEGETLSSIAMEVKFFDEVGIPLFDIDLHQFATPFPGTSFFQTSQQNGITFMKNWSDYRTDRVNYIPQSFLNSNFPSLKNIASNSIPTQLNWNGALNRDDGNKFATGVWELLSDKLDSTKCTVADAVDYCVDNLGISGKTEEDVIKAVALIALVGGRDEAYRGIQHGK